MKTSLNELQWMEDGLLGHVSGEQRILFEAQLLLDPAFQEAARWQRKTYGIIRDHGRQQLRHELEHVHRELFTTLQHRSFREKVLAFFRQ
ncbi:hypothetical protein [Parapedobacter sp. DT-150]|uniref:hypothetical protein n=1 Tax=Parapedobacter sp. DT-150 TaxID=3396162 RepID=UPI003F1DFFEF